MDGDGLESKLSDRNIMWEVQVYLSRFIFRTMSVKRLKNHAYIREKKMG